VFSLKKNSKIIAVGCAVIIVAILVISSNPGYISFFIQSVNSITLRPNKDIYNNNLKEGSWNSITISGGTTFYNSVNEYSSDGNVSYIYLISYEEMSPNKVIFGLLPMTQNETIGKIIIHYSVATVYGISVVRPFLNFENTEFTIGDDWLSQRGYAHNYINITTKGYHDFTEEWSINPKTLQNWTVNDLNNLYVGFEMKCLSNYASCRLTQFYVDAQSVVKSTTSNPPVTSNPQPIPKQTPGFELISLVVAVGIAAILLKKRKK